MSSEFSISKKQAAVAALKAYKEEPFVSHEWAELVVRLSHDSDPRIREQMYREMDAILQKDPGFKRFGMF